MSYIAQWMPAIITGIISIIVCLINNHYSAKGHFKAQTAQIEDMVAHNEETIAIIETQIEGLRKEVEAHNKIVERTYVLEGRADKFCTITQNLDRNIMDLKRAIEKLEDKVK